MKRLPSGCPLGPSARALTALVPALVLGLAVVVTPAPAAAQVPTLPTIDSLLTAGDYDGARSNLDRWWSARQRFDVPGSDMARALMLRAQLEPDPRAAESDYLSLVLGYPTSPLAPDALLRLGQGLLATGDATRASAYLQRLVNDYPGRAQRPTAQLWLARAHSAGRRYAVACAAATDGLQDARDPHVVAMLRIEAASTCSIDGQRPVASDRPSTLAPTGEWSVQTGAFRQRASADALVERLRRAGYSPRIVRVPGNDLLRVRVGEFTTSDEAADLLTRLRDHGFDAIVVGDVTRERNP